MQSGARYAVATDVIPSGLNSKDFVGFACPDNTLEAGDPVCEEALGKISCTQDASSVSCSCAETSLGAASCENVTGAADINAFNNIVGRMRVIDAGITPNAVTVSYSGSGIGYAGDPSLDDDDNPLSDIAPIVTVEISNLPFRLFFMLGREVTLPRFSYSLTLEDGVGAIAY